MRALMAFNELVPLPPSVAMPVLQAHDWDVATTVESYLNSQTDDELQLVA